MLLKEVPRDEDEPFFILSLTEIPVTVPEPLPYRPAAEQERPVAALPPQGVVPSVPHSCAEKDFLLPQPSAIGVPGERSAAAACLEGSGETGLVRQDAGACAVSEVERNHVRPQCDRTCVFTCVLSSHTAGFDRGGSSGGRW